jgi:hypothetical protein
MTVASATATAAAAVVATAAAAAAVVATHQHTLRMQYCLADNDRSTASCYLCNC